MPISIKDYLYLGAIAVLVAGFFWFRSHEISIGEKRCQAAVEAAVSKARIDQAAEYTRQANEVNQIGAKFNETVTKPIAAPPVVRVCVNSVRSRSVPGAASAASADHAEATNGAADTSDTEGRDIGEPLVTAGRNADAQIDALQRYINDVCLKHL